MAFVSPHFRSIVLDSYEHVAKTIPKGSWAAIEHNTFGDLLEVLK